MAKKCKQSVFTDDRAATGIAGLDEVLRGGLPRGRTYLVRGANGTGKTTLGFQFLLEGVRQGEPVMYATLLQARSELEAILDSHGWSLDGIDLVELPQELRNGSAAEQTLFNPADVELNEATDAILRGVEEHQPKRLVLDSIGELAVLVESPHRFRRQVLKLKTHLSERGCTSLLITGDNAVGDFGAIQTLVHGVVALQMAAPAYGPAKRRLEITKMRGMAYAGGNHDFRIRTGGLEVYPRLEMAAKERRPDWSLVASGNADLDALLGGGMEAGTACLITGTSGAGKSTLATLYVQAAADRGDPSVIFCFEERSETFRRRAEGLGLKITRHIDEGIVDLRQINVGDLSPGEFVQQVRQAVDRDGARVVVIDSLGGYLHAMPEARALVVQLHELLGYLAGQGVLTLLIVASHGHVGGQPLRGNIEVDASYIADTVVLMRHFEAGGRMHRCVAVTKKRHGPHEHTIRELRLGEGGITVGPPLERFSGVLTGEPTYHGPMEELITRAEEGAEGDGL